MEYGEFLRERRRRMADIIRVAFRQLGGEPDSPPLTPPWFLPGAEAVWQRIVETERALRGVVREVYAARFGEAAAQRIEEALPERERETLARALRARPAGSEPLSIVDYLYLGQLHPCSSRRTLGRMLVAVWAVRRTQSSGFSLPSARSRLSATRSLTSARLIATAFFARASHAPTCWRCCNAGRKSGRVVHGNTKSAEKYSSRQRSVGRAVWAPVQVLGVGRLSCSARTRPAGACGPTNLERSNK